MFGSIVHSFQLRLPEEANLLPDILDLLLKFAAPRRMDKVRRDPTSAVVAIRKALDDYIKECASLSALVAIESLPLDIRVAAILLREIHSKSTFDCVCLFEALEQVGFEKLDEWSIVAIARILHFFAHPIRSEGAMVLLGRLHEVSREDYFRRQALATVLSQWREISGAPVSEGNVLSKWLAA